MRSLSLPSLSHISRSACRLGSSGFTVRPSTRGLGGFVAVVGFSRPALAAQFARCWAVLLPAACGGCFVRRAGRLSWVSVPVLPVSVPGLVRSGVALSVFGSPPACRRVVSAGGVWSC